MNLFSIRLAAALGLAVTSIAGIAGGASATDIGGAGATFPAPVYTAWASAYKDKSGTNVNYQGIGSGGGQTQVTNRTVDFGGSDAPMTPEQLDKAKLLQFPAIVGAVVPIVNLDGIAADQLHLTGAIIGDIYLGKITPWNDPKIAALNPDAKLPQTAIIPVYRSDSSGTTYVFTGYLSAVSPEWEDKIGVATSVQWAAGVGAKGNDGVAGSVKNTAGAIGYVEYVYAASNQLTTVELQNKVGKMVKPTVEAFQAAAAKADWAGAKNFAASMIDRDGKTAWPIVSATFILLPKDPKDHDKSAEVMKFFDWAYKDGGAVAEKLHYIQIPTEVMTQVRKAWKAEVMNTESKAIYYQFAGSPFADWVALA